MHLANSKPNNETKKVSCLEAFCHARYHSTLSISQIPESARKVLLRQERRGNLSLHFYINSILPKVSAPLYYSTSYAWPIGVKTLLQAEVIFLFKTSTPSLPNLRLAIRLYNLGILKLIFQFQISKDLGGSLCHP